MNNQIKEEGLTDAYLLGKYDGIKQGRADAESEHKEMCESCIHKVSAEDIEQIRADAIDLIDRHLWNYSHEVWEDFKPILEKIKEQK